MWWDSADGGPFSHERVIVQVMNLGTYDDIRRLEKEFSPRFLATVMRNAAPGWFSARSWEFWRGRLSVDGERVPDQPPRRKLDAQDARTAL
jgi:hypothetical protein